MAKTYAYTDEWGNDYKLSFLKTAYAYGGGIAIEALCEEFDEDISDETWLEPYAGVTTNLCVTSSKCCAYLDTNNSRHLIDWMIEEGLVELTGRTVQSGFCTYPEGEFSDEFLNGCLTDEDDI